MANNKAFVKQKNPEEQQPRLCTPCLIVSEKYPSKGKIKTFHIQYTTENNDK